MSIKVKMFPALNGDCFLIITGESNILIDGGYVNTYNDYLKPSLIELASQGKELSLVVVSHIDADHISGILKFIEENEIGNIIPVKNIWHNSFRHLQQEEQIDSSLNEGRIFGSIKKELLADSATIVSALQGSSLSSLILKYEYQWNIQFDGKVISTNHNNIAIDELNIKLLSPNQSKLESLQKYWRKELYKHGYIDSPHSEFFWDDAFEFLLAQEKPDLKVEHKNISHNNKDFDLCKLKETPFISDGSVTNGSSISFILQIGNKKMLFLADAHSDIIESELKNHFLLEEFPIFFDLIKLSHHGSFSNNSPTLLNLVDSDKWVISTNGKTYNHPDIETLAWIVSKDNNINRKLFFNYPLDICQQLSNTELKEKCNYEIITSKEEIIEISL